LIAWRTVIVTPYENDTQHVQILNRVGAQSAIDHFSSVITY
jgi:hypothetical protein